jgi:hypothetical protein
LNSKSRFKFKDFKFCIVWTDWLSQQFWEFIGIDLNHTFKREFIPDNFFYKCTNLQKLLRSGGICFRGLNRATQPSFQTEDSPRKCLTISYIWNSITSSTFVVSLCMSTKSKFNIFRSPWSTPCPSLSPDEFVLVVSISLGDQFLGFFLGIA